jgi:hypothetical protein
MQNKQKYQDTLTTGMKQGAPMKRAEAMFNLLREFGLDPDNLNVTEAAGLIVDIRGAVLTHMLENPEVGDKLSNV